MITSIVSFILLLGVLIFVHELGHFLLAKWNKVRVEKFSLGFGPRIIGFQKGETEYRISAIPLGGYVKLAGENPDEEITGANDELPSKKPLQKLQIFIAGPAMNYLFAILVTIIISLFGVLVPAFFPDTPILIGVVDDSPASDAGLAVGDRILAVNDTQVTSWEQTLKLMSVEAGRTLRLTLERDGSDIERSLTLREDPDTGYPTSGLRIPWRIRVVEVASGSAAQEAGLMTGDVIHAINDIEIYNEIGIQEIIGKSEGNTLKLRVQRDGETTEISAAARFDKAENRWILGFNMMPQYIKRSYGFSKSVTVAIETNWQMTKQIFQLIGNLLTGQASIKNLGGPILIAHLAGQAAKSGIIELLRLAALISLNLAVLNILPIPVLDGGHILLLIPEFFTRRPVSLKKRLLAQQIGLGILLILFVVIFYNDILRLVT